MCDLIFILFLGTMLVLVSLGILLASSDRFFCFHQIFYLFFLYHLFLYCRFCYLHVYPLCGTCTLLVEMHHHLICTFVVTYYILYTTYYVIYTIYTYVCYTDFFCLCYYWYYWCHNIPARCTSNAILLCLTK